MKKLFVGGLSWNTDDSQLNEAFARFGKVASAKVITDRDTGRSRGFGFVEFESGDDAQSALQAMDGHELDGRTIKVDFAQERERSGGGGNRKRGGGGGNRRDRY
jgi:RNA recognition motif-containing protein